MELPEIERISKMNGLALSAESLKQLGTYASELASWNAKINLVSRKDEANILSKHILHSLTLLMSIAEYDFTGKRILDVGTGGGLPGIPIAIVRPSAKLLLVDSIGKKITACQAMIASLGITNAVAINGRAEVIAKQPDCAGKFDVVVSRAVAPLDDLVTWTREFLHSTGSLFSLKGGDLTEEVARTNQLRGVQKVSVRPLALIGYDDFLNEEKKLVRVDFRSVRR